MKNRSSTLAGQVAANVIEVLIGGKRSLIVLFVVAIFSVATNLISGGVDKYLPAWAGLILGVLLFLFILALVYFGIRHIASAMKIRVLQDDNPPTCKVLILFLSPVGGDRTTAENITRGAIPATIENPGDRQSFKASWRMPLEAIAHHMTRLEKVIVVPSADSPGKTDGTYRDLDLFVGTVKKMCGDNGPELLSPKDLGLNSEHGVDFETAEALVSVLESIYARLREKGYPDYEILIDITGGQKVPTVAGATVALDVGRRIQYVSLRDYHVRVYDFTVSSPR